MILAVFDHLWQSTLFTLVVALLVLTMRNNQASARFGLWLAASLKLLIPFSVLIAAGKQLGWTGGKADMECLFGRELPMERCRRHEIRWIVFAVCVIAIGWLRAKRLRGCRALHATAHRSS